VNPLPLQVAWLPDNVINKAQMKSKDNKKGVSGSSGAVLSLGESNFGAI